MKKTLAGGIGIGLVATMSVVLFAGYSYASHSGIGMMGPRAGHYLSESVCSPSTKWVGQTINVSVIDMGMMMGRVGRMNLSASPSTVSAGKLNIVVTNLGMRTHELVILPLAANQSAGSRIVGADGRVDETSSVGEVSNNCASGTGEGILSGSRGWSTLTLTPGRYEFICNIPNHYSAGMYQEVLVT